MGNNSSNNDLSVEEILANCSKEEFEKFADLASLFVFKMPLRDLIKSSKRTSKPFTKEELRALAVSGVAIAKEASREKADS